MCANFKDQQQKQCCARRQLEGRGYVKQWRPATRVKASQGNQSRDKLRAQTLAAAALVEAPVVIGTVISCERFVWKSDEEACDDADAETISSLSTRPNCSSGLLPDAVRLRTTSAATAAATSAIFSFATCEHRRSYVGVLLDPELKDSLSKMILILK